VDITSDQVNEWFWLVRSRVSMFLALETWDAMSWHDLAAQEVAVARELAAPSWLSRGTTVFSQFNSGVLGDRLYYLTQRVGLN
jgi:hypothetical protein